MLLYNPVITLLCVYPKEIKTYIHTKTYTQMFTAALFITAPNLVATKISFNRWKQINCGIPRQWEYYSWLKRNALSNIKRYKGTSWVSERIQSEKATYYVITIKWHSVKGKIMETVKRSVVVRGWGEGRDEQGEHRELLRQWNYSVWYHNDGYMPLCILCICLNPQTIYNTKNEP